MTPFPLLPRICLVLLLSFSLSARFVEAESSAPSPSAAESPERDSTSPGAEAVKRVKNLGFRLTSKGNAPSSLDQSGSNQGDPTSENTASLPTEGESSMFLGPVEGPVSLPPEVEELGKEGALAVAAENWEEARTIYLQMIKEVPNNALAYANLGVVEFELGNLLAAAGNLNRSTELNPHIARNWQTLGLIHYERGDLTLALSCLARAVHEGPEEAETRLILAAVIRDYGWSEAAITELQRAVEINPKLAAAHYNLAVTYLGQTPPRLELARRHYYAAIDLGTPPSPEIEAVLKVDQ